ncbi:hypothetical protein [Photobacterium angustum]|nr:hypothetical protein [Photobacterium angustum]
MASKKTFLLNNEQRQRTLALKASNKTKNKFIIEYRKKNGIA